MKIPQLEKKLELKSCHNVTWEDNYSWIHQKDILEVLKDSSKLLPNVKKYLEDENRLFVPKEGKLLIWPSHLLHGSHPYSGKKDRTIISINSSINLI